MIPSLRTAFNSQWTEGRYAEFRRLLGESAGVPIEFPVSETPCFLPRALMDELAATGVELTQQAIGGDAAAAAERVIPERFRGPNQGDVPLFVQVDFGLARTANGAIEPRLVELQAFPSLYAFQLALADAYVTAFQPGGPSAFAYASADKEAPPLQTHLDGLTRPAYLDIARKAIVGDHDPAEVVLMEIAPEKQKTRPDFELTEKYWGVRAIEDRKSVV